MSKESNIDAGFFAANRRRLLEVFSGTAPVVITANGLMQRSLDIVYPFTQDSNFWYLTGLSNPEYVLVLDRGKEYLIAPKQNIHRDIFDGVVDEATILAQSGIETVYDFDTGWQRLGKRLKKAKYVATLEAPAEYVETYEMFTNPSRRILVSRMKDCNAELEFIDLRLHLARLRMKKSPIEIALIKQGISQTIELFKVIEKVRKNNRSEQEIDRAIKREIIDQGTEFGYDPIVAAGKNAIALHYSANSETYKSNDLVLIDIGVKKHIYSADLTRTVADEPTKRQQAVYDAVLSVHTFASSLLKPGIDKKTYEQAVEKYLGEKLRELGLIKSINRETVRKFYPHLTSHHLGIDLHDVADYDAPLAPGMVVTVEPGIYIKDEGIGIRLEDDVLITDSGFENLSIALPKNIRSLTIDPDA